MKIVFKFTIKVSGGKITKETAKAISEGIQKGFKEWKEKQ